MARFTRLEVYQKMHEYPIVPLLSSNNVDDSLKIVEACYKGGIRVFEFTNRGDFAHEIFIEMAKYIRQNCPEMAFGIGTILDAGTASLYIQNGADFVICPNLVEEVAKVCNRRKIAWIPGVATLSEISKAEELGAEIVKIFPGQVLGSPFVKALKAPMPHTSVMATGGVELTQASLKEWFEAGVTCVGIGGKLVSKEMLDTKNFQFLTDTLSESLKFIRNKCQNG
jgi:2-dehydro-3-deoxyphosphogluconate aldolase / (4S)-4-hydroxy-2-oxoglutarate aldolase